MDLEKRLSASPFLEFVGVDIVTVNEGYAKATVVYTDDILGIPQGDAL
jgi:acyl-coenzyme A thioesterase PaaI-like protein